MKKHGKRKVNDVRKNEEKKHERKKEIYKYVNNNRRNDENSENNEQEYKYPKNRKLLNDKLLKQSQHDSIIAASKASCGLIEKIMTQNENESKEINNDNNIINEADTNNDNTNNNNINNINSNQDNLLLSSIYELFDGYDEIIIKPATDNQYIINATINLENNAEIKFQIIYDKERDYFDYYPNNKNFRFDDEDEPFNFDLDIPKEDFPLLIKNFKKFKFKNK